MIIILQDNANLAKIQSFKSALSEMGLKLNQIKKNIILASGNMTDLIEERISAYEIVEKVQKIKEPYILANRKVHPDNTIVDICGRKFGGEFQVIAGPCSIESEEQINKMAVAIKTSGAGLFRGGAFKPRTSPYSFQGLREEGLKLLLNIKKTVGLPIVTEITTTKELDLYKDVDIIQVGARNMQNYELLKELGKLSIPILLKRGMANTIDELLMSAEYILSGGNEKVILCERGIRTFETSTRNTLDISAIPVLKKKSHLPVIVDPSHASGIRYMIEPLTLAAIAAGADGVMIEVHNDPESALCDGQQSLTLELFEALMRKIEKTVTFFNDIQ